MTSYRSKKKSRRQSPKQRQATPGEAPGAAAAEDRPGEHASFPIVGVGASAGGLEAFTQLLKALPLDTGMGFVLVQHLDPEHESALTQILARVTSLPVSEISDNMPVEPNQVYVIPRDTNLSIAEGMLKLGPRQKTRAPHRPIDSFFESLAEDQGDQAIGVVLSGTASDGTLGLEAIKAEGGITFAQDNSAKHDSMPRSAVAAGCVDLVLSPAEIAQELARIAKHPYAAGQPLARLMRAEEDRAQATAHEDDLAALPSGGRGTRSGGRQARAEVQTPVGADEGYKKILLLLHNHSGVDFSLYKSTTIQRRIGRRMILTKQNTPAEYGDFLRGNASEIDALYSDVLIGVTSFFRNPEMFDVLKRKVLPELLKQPGDDPLRCWVLGCSTGQEAYSIAMAFVEVAEKGPRMRTLQLFATDLNDALLDKARHGLYAKTLAEEIRPERLRRFFVEEEGGYRISKQLREMVVFARQNLIADPPFSRMDLVSCRNLLIYLEPSLQKKALPTFHYALKPHGFLLLGASESIGGFTDLFEPVDKKHKIYSRKAAPTPAGHLPIGRVHGEPLPPVRRSTAATPQAGALEPPEGLRGELAAQREADRISLKQFAPPGVLVNAELQILQFRGSTGVYLELPSGKATLNVLTMAREGLMLPLRSAVEEARKEKRTARRTNVRVKQNGRTRKVNLEVIPLRKPSERCFLIVFEEADRSARAGRRAVEQPTPPPLSREQERNRVAELETDLAEMREYLQSMQEQHEVADEELQAANEEVQSANEELQSVNEELETSKEELESANEELITVNEEMNSRNLELTRVNDDLVNLQSSAKLAVVLLSRGLMIRRFSPQAQKQFDLNLSDVGRPIGHVRHNLVSALPAYDSRAPADDAESSVDLETMAAEVIASIRECEREVQDRGGCWYSLRAHPYMTLDNKVGGAVLVLVNIDALKRAEQEIAVARDSAENIIETVREPLLVLDGQLRVQSANGAFYRTFHVAPTETIGTVIYDLGNRQWDVPRLRELLEQVLSQRASVEDFLVEHDFPSGVGSRAMLLNARVIHNPHGTAGRILVAIEDITERRQAEQALQAADRRKSEFLAMLAHELRNPLAPIRNAAEILRLHDGDKQHTRPAIEMLHRQLRQMSRIIDDLLDVNRISRGTIALRKESIELLSIVELAAEAARTECERMGHELTITLPPRPVYVHADPTRLAQIVGNLLNNACKFTERGGRVLLSVKGDDEQAVIQVQDTGIGIAPEQLPMVFDMFMQVDTSLKRARDGLGLGLTLVKNLVELQAGTVEARSAGLGRGSTFVVRLPVVSKPPEPRSQRVHRVATIPVKRRVLVVDDNRDAAESLAILLKLSGHDVYTAHDGLEAVDSAAKIQPDVVLLDIGLPKIDGYEAARRIRQQEQEKRVMLVALTGWGQEEDRRRSEEATFDLHLVKPVDLATLTKVLAESSAG